VKVILDECLPRRLVRDLQPHLVTTVSREGWAGSKNGALLKLIIPEFDVFITVDGNLIHQQNLQGMSLRVIILHAVNNRYETLEPLVPGILQAIDQGQAGAIVHIGS